MLLQRRRERRYLTILSFNIFLVLFKSLVFKALQKKTEWKKAVLYGSAEKTFDCPVLIIPIVVAFRSCVDLVLMNAINVGLFCTHSNRDGTFIFIY